MPVFGLRVKEYLLMVLSGGAITSRAGLAAFMFTHITDSRTFNSTIDVAY
jgi:hypothetical protein